ncbi:hypothetical protein [Neobacillus sp. LXY-1]|uniref:hypothetical protein n=1 Tax=Neobacillus sp. LXY-1 TaxID=3379133 RepID=UPI003EDF6634
MNPVQVIQSLINVENVHKATVVPLKPGQMVYGSVEKFLPNDTAIVRIGNRKLFADVKTLLSTNENYWFEVVTSSNEGVQLKVLEQKGSANSSHFLLKNFQLPETKQNQQLLQFFLSKNVPFTKEQLKIAGFWLPNQTDLTKELTALEWMARKDLPFTKPIFDSLVAVQDARPLNQQLSELVQQLDGPQFASFQSTEPLKQVIASIIGTESFNQVLNGNEAKHMLQSLIHSLGLEYEKDVGQISAHLEDTTHVLKPILMEAISELGSKGKELEPLLNRLTGLQLLSQDFTGTIQQMVMQLPITLGNQPTDVTIQWNGRKTKEAQIDPDYCRILFYLDLQSLDQTVIDMQVQNKVVHLSIINDTNNLEPVVNALTPSLKEKLETIGYKLSFVNIIPSSEKRVEHHVNKPEHLFMEAYHGVDIKI